MGRPRYRTLASCTDKDIAALPLVRLDVHGEQNYTLGTGRQAVAAGH